LAGALAAGGVTHFADLGKFFQDSGCINRRVFAFNPKLGGHFPDGSRLPDLTTEDDPPDLGLEICESPEHDVAACRNESAEMRALSSIAEVIDSEIWLRQREDFG